jgi:myo-inositol-1(or 4)-monophosphatase
VSTELARLLSIARTAVEHGATYLRTHQPSTITAKGDRDMVTDLDLTIERLIRDELTHHTPDIGVHGEEEGGPTTGTWWVLDPIDGTANLTHRIPLTGISLALVHANTPVLGVIALPMLSHTYWAATGLGAFRDGHSITASRPTTLAASIVAIGDYATGPTAGARNATALAIHAALAPHAQRIRMLGSAAVDLAWTADASLAASITLGNRPWDMAAGSIIAREAGAHVVDLDGTPHDTTSRFTIAATPNLLPQILDVVRQAAADTGLTRAQTPC